MCTVFAESEVIGLLHRGEPRRADRPRPARGGRPAHALRLCAGCGAAPPLLFAGGGARNPALVELIAAGVGGEVLVAPDPQTVGALGAALHGERGA